MAHRVLTQPAMGNSSWRGLAQVTRVATVLLVSACIGVGCNAGDDGNGPREGDDQRDRGAEDIGTSTAAITGCGVVPKAPVCERAVCVAADHSWDFVPLAAGTVCNTTGKCDGDGRCVMGPPPPPPTPRIMDFTSTDIVELQVDITGGAPITYETRNCSAGADPVLHLFKPGSNSDQRVQLAVDDNGAGGVNARVSLTPATGGIGFLIPRAKNDAHGTCDIWRNGYPWQYGIAVGGKTVTVSGALVGDSVETVAMPLGGQYQAIYMLSGDSITQKWRSGLGTGLSTRFTMNSTGASFLVHGTGPTRVVVNDVNSDADGDGLGDRVEAALGTCSSSTGTIGNFNCAWAKTPKDTDGDGLSDAWEILGKRDIAPHQLLPQWGANPRHKDMFVEVDYMADGKAPLHLDAQGAHAAAAYWQDTVAPLSSTTLAVHGAILMNPDGLPGVSMHFDTGLPPGPGAPLEDYTLYGNWGGYDVAPAGTKYEAAWRQFLNPARFGVFHWGLGVRGGGGQTASDHFAFTANIQVGSKTAHELGHTVGLAHFGATSAGPLNCKPQYLSPMNYGYSDMPYGFSDGSVPGPLNNTALLEYGNLEQAPNRAQFADLYQNVFSYFVDRTTWSVDFDRDGQIAPPGVRVRANANFGPGMECEATREHRNPFLDGGLTTHSPAVVRSGGKLMIFTATDSGLEVRMGTDTYANCTTIGGGIGDQPCGSFSGPFQVVSGKVQAVDAVNVKLHVGEQVVFTYVDGAGALRSGSIGWSSVNTPLGVLDANPLAPSIIGEPAMTMQAPNLGLLVFKTAAGLKQVRFIADVGWYGMTTAIGPTGSAFTVSDAPGVVLGRMPGDTVDAVYMHATSNINGNAQSLFLKLGDDDRWYPTAFTATNADVRPGLAYVPNASDPTKGKMYALTIYYNAIRMRQSYVQVAANGTRLPSFGLDTSFDNEWYTGLGVDLMFEPGHDTNLRAVVVPSAGDWMQKAVFQPLADGIVDLSYSGFNDLGQIAKGMCAAIANPGGNTVANPIPCF